MIPNPFNQPGKATRKATKIEVVNRVVKELKKKSGKQFVRRLVSIQKKGE